MAVYGCLLGGVVVLLSITAYLVPGYLDSISRKTVEKEVALNARTISIDLARSLHEDWIELRHLAEKIGSMAPDEARSYLNGIVGDGQRISWAGYATTDGTVRVASGGLLEDVDVSEQTWFRNGLNAVYSGDLHEAIQMKNVVEAGQSGPLKFIDLAKPVFDRNGTTIGVVAFYVNFQWIRDYLSESAAARSIDFLLLSTDGTVAAASFDLPENRPSLAAIRAAMAGIKTTTLETWPDGNEYFSAVDPDVVYEDLPSFGWRLIGRMPVDANSFEDNQLMLNAMLFVFGACLVFSIAAAMFVAIFINPISRLAEVARRVSLGEDVYPPEGPSSREASRIASALARIQSRLHSTQCQRRSKTRPLGGAKPGHLAPPAGNAGRA